MFFFYSFVITLSCYLCFRTFVSPRHLRSHIENFHHSSPFSTHRFTSPSSIIWGCMICGRGFNVCVKLERHVSRNHCLNEAIVTEKPYLWEIMKKKTQTRKKKKMVNPQPLFLSKKVCFFKSGISFHNSIRDCPRQITLF